jgi:nitrogenase-stabilizing/protective protein
MGVLEDLKRLSAAEEIFQYLGVEFDPKVVNVARLHILKRMGQYLAREAEAEQVSDEALRERCAEHLRTAYADFLANTPIEARLFKVHQDAVKEQKPQPRQLVSLEPLRRT